MQLLLTTQRHETEGLYREANKNTYLTIKWEVYCCTNSIMRKEDLENIGSDPKLIGVMEIADPN